MCSVALKNAETTQRIGCFADACLSQQQAAIGARALATAPAAGEVRGGPGGGAAWAVSYRTGMGAALTKHLLSALINGL